MVRSSGVTILLYLEPVGLKFVCEKPVYVNYQKESAIFFIDLNGHSVHDILN